MYSALNLFVNKILLSQFYLNFNRYIHQFLSRVESYQRLKKWYLMTPYLTLSIIRYGSRVKWNNPPLHLGAVAIEKGDLGVTLPTVAKLKYLHRLFIFSIYFLLISFFFFFAFYFASCLQMSFFSVQLFSLSFNFYIFLYNGDCIAIIFQYLRVYLPYSSVPSNPVLAIANIEYI